MASAEQLLHDAQYAFSCITFGESRQNRRNAARVSRLCRKIIRRFPATMEAGEADALLKRMGERGYTSKLAVAHRHTTQREHHRPGPKAQATSSAQVSNRTWITRSTETLDWSGLVSLLFAIPRVVLLLIAFAAIFLFGIFGPWLLLGLLAFVLFTGPFRQLLKQQQQDQVNDLIARVNELIRERRNSGGGFG